MIKNKLKNLPTTKNKIYPQNTHLGRCFAVPGGSALNQFPDGEEPVAAWHHHTYGAEADRYLHVSLAP